MPVQEQETNSNLGQYVQVVRHRKWWLISGLLVGWAAVTLISWVIPPKYRSEATILVDRQQVSERLVAPNVEISVQQKLDAISQQVLSRSKLKAIIETYNLYPGQRKKGMTSDDVVDLMRKDIGLELVTTDKRKADALTGFKVSYVAPSAELAQRVTSELAGAFIKENLQTTIENSKEATEFFDKQLQDAAKDLAEQEKKLSDFKLHYLGSLPEQLQSNLQILSGLQGRLQAANEGLNRAQQQQTYLQSLLSQYHTSDGSSDSVGSAPSSIDQRLVAMRAQLASLKAQYTEKHPDVVKLEQDIAATEALKKKMEADPSATPPMTETNGVTSLAQLKSQLKVNEMEIANRKKAISAIESDIASYQARLNQTPVREQELATIIRNHEQSQANYNSLLARKQQSDLANSLVNTSQGEQFRLVDPASLPQKPDFPDHFKFSLGGIGAGLALGLCLTVIVELKKTFIYTEEQVLSLVKAPVLTSVPSLWTVSEQNQHKRRAMLQNIAASVVLALIPLGTIVAFLHG